MALQLLHYLVPFGLLVLDTRCYAVELESTQKVLLMPQKLLKGSKSDSPLDLEKITKKLVKLIAGQDAPAGQDEKEEILLRMLKQMQAQMTEVMDHTMETIYEVLNR